MSHGYYEQIIDIGPVDDAEREAPQHDPASAYEIWATVQGKGDDPARSTLDLREELGAQSGPFLLVPGDGSQELILGCGQERNIAHFRSARAFANTSADETV
jgi:hypothetical protein